MLEWFHRLLCLRVSFLPSSSGSQASPVNPATALACSLYKHRIPAIVSLKVEDEVHTAYRSSSSSLWRSTRPAKKLSALSGNNLILSKVHEQKSGCWRKYKRSCLWVHGVNVFWSDSGLGGVAIKGITYFGNKSA
jgi:hypothetical protein